MASHALEGGLALVADKLGTLRALGRRGCALQGFSSRSFGFRGLGFIRFRVYSVYKGLGLIGFRVLGLWAEGFRVEGSRA